MIDFFSNDDLQSILGLLKSNQNKNPNEALEKFVASEKGHLKDEDIKLFDDRSKEEIKKDEEDLYNIKNFSI